MGAVVIRNASDVPGAACLAVGFIPIESVVVLGFGPITPVARFDIGSDIFASAEEVIERFRPHGVTQGVVAIFTSRGPDLLPEVIGAFFEASGFDVLDLVVVDGERAMGWDGRTYPWLAPNGMSTREEFARARGLDPLDAFVIGQEPGHATEEDR